jgi:anti-sigma factor RsiW
LTMQCRDVRELLDSYLGQELMVETNHDLMRHLETCPDCRAELEARRQLRTRLREAFTTAHNLQPRQGFALEALAKLRDERPARRRWSIVPMWGALAASVLLVAAVSVLFVRGRVSTVARDAVGDHRNCAVKFALSEPPILLAEAAARFDPVYSRLLDTPPDDFVTVAGPLRVIDRHSCVFASRRFGHVVLQLEGHLVSLLVTAEDQSSEQSRGRLKTTPSWLPRVDGQRVASFETPGHAVFVVSDLGEEQFRAVAEALMKPVSTRLALSTRSMPTSLGN